VTCALEFSGGNEKRIGKREHTVPSKTGTSIYDDPSSILD
jgi:hypothetical protein